MLQPGSMALDPRSTKQLRKIAFQYRVSLGHVGARLEGRELRPRPARRPTPGSARSAPWVTGAAHVWSVPWVCCFCTPGPTPSSWMLRSLTTETNSQGPRRGTAAQRARRASTPDRARELRHENCEPDQLANASTHSRALELSPFASRLGPTDRRYARSSLSP